MTLPAATDTARTPTPPDPPPTPRRPGRPVTLGLVTIAIGALWLASVAGVPVPWDVALPSALLVVGLTLVVRPRGGQDGVGGLAVILLLATLVLTVLPGGVVTGVGDREVVATAAEALDAPQQLAVGTLTIDLREADVTDGAELRAQVGVGELTVLVPDGVRVAVRARAGLGEVRVLDESRSGVAPSLDLPAPAGDDDPVLTLDLQVGLGQLEVRR